MKSKFSEKVTEDILNYLITEATNEVVNAFERLENSERAEIKKEISNIIDINIKERLEIY
jgi:formate dehydrogenase maturation protein FdhE